MLTNVTISGNHATNGGGMYNFDFSPVLTNVTISGNHATNEGGGMYNYSLPQIRNSIIWGNTAGTGDNVYNASNSNSNNKNKNNSNNISILPTFTCSLVQGGSSGWTAFGINNGNNIDDDPKFVSPVAASSAPTTAGDYRLQAGSPAIDAGNRSYFTGGNTPDLSGIKTGLDGNSRIMGGSIDIGAYEYQGN